MSGLTASSRNLQLQEQSQSQRSSDFGVRSNIVLSVSGGLFLEPAVPSSFVNFVSSRTSNSVSSRRTLEKKVPSHAFLALSLRIEGCVPEQKIHLVQKGEGVLDEAVVVKEHNAVLDGIEKHRTRNWRPRGTGAMNTTKHLWAGAIASMVSRTFVAPLERLKLEYIIRGEKKHLFELINTIAASQGLRGFWKGNLVNILRTAPFKAVNYYAYDTYRKHFLRLSQKEESANFVRFIAGASAGITATVLCLPLDTIRTNIVAPGGEALGGVFGAFRHMIQTEGFFSLYKGLIPSILSVAPSAAVFYSVYDILKSTYLHSSEGRKRILSMSQRGQKLNALDQLELGPVRILLYGAVSGACAEVATYPFEVVRRRLQLQVQGNRMNALATCAKIVEQGGIPALYVGLVPSLLQVLPSASVSFFIYEFMKIVLKVE